MCAIWNDHQTVAEELIMKGADINLRTTVRIHI